MKMTEIYGLKKFSLTILQLIAKGEKESIETINNCIEKGVLVEYITEKYPSYFDTKDFNGKETVEKFYYNLAGIAMDEGEKLEIDDNGLLVIIALAIVY